MAKPENWDCTEPQYRTLVASYPRLGAACQRLGAARQPLMGDCFVVLLLGASWPIPDFQN